ncbi:MAG: hypothetical protein EOP32_02290 [Rhodococcus sp. (in: high G+C Gram-positive bacteria)]|nr:MAG: hypothetical protein EOP32_02290 [Rhodococcus sp. (in: high G+C Gram-positive bacteria)]
MGKPHPPLRNHLTACPEPVAWKSALDITSTVESLLFGIYPGSVTGADTGGLAVGPPDDPSAISAALDELPGDAPWFLIRTYVSSPAAPPVSSRPRRSHPAASVSPHPTDNAATPVRGAA